MLIDQTVEFNTSASEITITHRNSLNLTFLLCMNFGFIMSTLGLT